MITYTWTVANYFVRPSFDGLTNVVDRVGWHLVAERDGQTALRMGVTELPPATSASFVPWDTVTDEMALDWVRTELEATPGLSVPDGVEAPTALFNILDNLRVDLDNLPPPTVTMPPKSPTEPTGLV